MEALVATVVLLVLGALGFRLLANAWPRTSPHSGYRARTEDARDERDLAGPPAREDDDARWRWKDDAGPRD